MSEPEIKVKPIRPTVVTVNSEEEYNAFVDWAEGRVRDDNPNLEKVRERFRNHVRSQKRRDNDG